MSYHFGVESRGVGAVAAVDKPVYARASGQVYRAPRPEPAAALGALTSSFALTAAKTVASALPGVRLPVTDHRTGRTRVVAPAPAPAPTQTLAQKPAPAPAPTAPKPPTDASGPMKPDCPSGWEAVLENNTYICKNMSGDLPKPGTPPPAPTAPQCASGYHAVLVGNAYVCQPLPTATTVTAPAPIAPAAPSAAAPAAAPAQSVWYASGGGTAATWQGGGGGGGGGGGAPLPVAPEIYGEAPAAAVVAQPAAPAPSRFPVGKVLLFGGIGIAALYLLTRGS